MQRFLCLGASPGGCALAKMFLVEDLHLQAVVSFDKEYNFEEVSIPSFLGRLT